MSRERAFEPSDDTSVYLEDVSVSYVFQLKGRLLPSNMEFRESIKINQFAKRKSTKKIFLKLMVKGSACQDRKY
jgi:hypothetical protein